MTLQPTRPVLRWHGGKWILAPWIISHFPKHRVYVEPYGGAGSVLMRKPRAYAEVWNDLDGEAVNLFQVLRFMGFGSNGHARSTGFRANCNRSGTTPAHDWINYPDSLAISIARLAGVVIECRDALDVMTAHDGPESLHYVDPPYVHSTRADLAKDYHTEMSDIEHGELLTFLNGLTGYVVLSGYPSDLYESGLLAGWRRVEKLALADGAAERTEVLWINPLCAAALDREQLPMFARLESA